MKETEQTIRVWITQYCLTAGITSTMAHLCRPNMIQTIEPANRCNGYFHGKGKNWHITEEDAVLVAELKRRKKIVQLKRQLTKLEALNFRQAGEKA